jgi:hypothetical protein
MEKLTPFTPISEDLSVQAEAKISGTILHARYLVKGPGIKNLLLPKPAKSEKPGKTTSSSRPERRDELWKTTCFELFLSLPGQSDYYELNFSPSENWNSYHFKSYREGMKTESRIEATEFRQEFKGDLYEFQSFVDLSALLPSSSPAPSLVTSFDTSLTAVIQNNENQISYWALKHTRDQADFHARESFVLKIHGPSAFKDKDNQS